MGTFHIDPDLIETYEDEPSGPFCTHCGGELDWKDCDACGGEGEYDAYELFPLEYAPDEMECCEECAGAGGWWYCTNQVCPGKRDGDADAT